ncbi:MAG: hypothetical protein ACKOSS_02415 [Planctomycetia bacterium]
MATAHAPTLPTDAPAGAGDARRAPALVLAGALMLAAALMLANPFFGSSTTDWPWEVLMRARSPLVMANWILWLLSGVLAIVLGLRGPVGSRATWLAAPALLLGLTCHSKLAGLRIEENSLAVNAGIGLLMAGFLLQAGREHDRAARLLSGLGGVLVLWSLACAFDYALVEVPRSQLVVKVGDLVSRLTGGEVTVALPNYDEHLATAGALVLGSALGVLALVGVRGALAGRLGMVLLLAAFCIRPVSSFVRVVSVEGFDAVTLAKHLAEVLVAMGLSWALFCAVVLSELVSAPPAGEGARSA